MSATAETLDLLLHLVKKVDTIEGQEFRVLPVIVDDLAGHRTLIEAAIASAGGQLFNAADLADGVVGNLRTDLQTVVTTVLNVPRSGGRYINLALQQDGEIVRATIDGERGTPGAGPGINTLLGLASLLFDSRLLESAFIVVTYSESVLEDDLSTAVWRLFTGHLSTHILENVRTIILLIESTKVRHDRHCTSGVSLWARLGAEGLQLRKEWNTDRALIGLLSHNVDSLTVFFLGAGFSASSRLPLGNELRDQALRRMMRSSDSYDISARAFRQSLETDGRLLPSELTMNSSEFVQNLTLERVLREELYRFQPANSPTLKEFQAENARAVTSPGRAVRALIDLMQTQQSVVLVTVNFDTLIEANAPTGTRVFSEDDEFDDCIQYLSQYRRSGGPTPILKLHGTIDKLETIVATVDEIARGLATSKVEALREIVRLNEPSPTNWVYVGYSMRDPDLTSVLSLREFGARLEETWVSPFMVSTARRFAEQHRNFGSRPGFWQRSITETADVFFEELVAAWR